MIGRHFPRAVGAARRGPAFSLFGEWLGRVPGNRYSRRVALLKVALPAIGVSLLLLVVVWPRVAPLFDRFRFQAIDLREARELRMINPRYAGTDREGRPFVITAAVGRQVPQRDDVMSLDEPVAHVQSHNGAKMVITSQSGVYQTQTQFLDMFGKVTVTHENGSTFTTTSARLDAVNDAAQGHDPVEGHGPQGNVTGQGFQMLDKGDIVIFTGRSNLLLTGSKQQDAPTTAPADVPAPVAQAAAQIEAKAEPKHAEPAHPRAKAATPPPHHAAKTRAHPRPTPPKKPG
ncbi:MAG TPA: LPS export ABC transporter periplasmic protein LptC [Stellaceae bacterium]|jgi:lipopolysaccharide export system protein LptC|nr:LPS export ABC transporter periplasmic protein LptC [Stellaceae bacterium]